MKAFGFATALCCLSVLPLATTRCGASPITPRETIRLFNGKDFSNFTTWERKHCKDDPDKVFSVVHVDGAPAIRCSGQHYGGVITHDSYTNYRLVVEFRWGLLS